MTKPVDYPYFVESPNGPMFTVRTVLPSATPRGNVVLCPGAWHGGSSLKNQMLVHLAHQLAVAGYQVHRFDWIGCGESPGHVDKFELLAPRTDDVEAIIRDAQAAAPLPLFLVGICFGALSLLAAAVDEAELSGVALVSLPVLAKGGVRAKEQRARRMGVRGTMRTAMRPTVIRGWFSSSTRGFYLKWLRLRLRKKRNTTARVSHDGMAQLESMLDRGVNALMLFGEEDWQASVADVEGLDDLHRILDRQDGQLELKKIQGDLIGFPSVDVQQRTNSVITEWLGAVPSGNRVGSETANPPELHES